MSKQVLKRALYLTLEKEKGFLHFVAEIHISIALSEVGALARWCVGQVVRWPGGALSQVVRWPGGVLARWSVSQVVR